VISDTHGFGLTCLGLECLMSSTLLRRRVRATSATLLLIVLCAATDASAQRVKVILDTDIGGDIDDAWALGLAMRSPALELLGVTITDGDTPARAKVACKLLHAGRRDDVPVAVGRKTHDHAEFQFAWAEDFTGKQPIAQAAADFIIDAVRKQPGEITLVAVGPLQNVADALRKDPGIAKLFKRVVLMSGSIAASAWHSAAVPEWNVVASAPDAQVVYAAGLPLTTVPLDSTTYVTLKDEERERLRKHDSPVTRSLEALYRLWLESPTARMTLHDQLAVAETVRPGAFFGRKETLALVVDDKGYTKVDAGRGKAASVCFEPKRDEFMAFYLDGLMATTGR
jgi:purine nucleosidase